MTQLLQLSEVYIMLGIDAKTFHKRSQRLSPPIEIIPDEMDKRIKRVSITDVRRLAKKYGISLDNPKERQAQTIPISEDSTDLEERFAALEEKVDRLESHIKALLELRYTPSTPRVKKTTEREIEHDDVPEGLTALFVFSRDHHVPNSTVNNAELRGHIKLIREEHRIGGRVVTNWLDKENHARAYHLWHHRPDFTPCPDCPTE